MLLRRLVLPLLLLSSSALAQEVISISGTLTTASGKAPLTANFSLRPRETGTAFELGSNGKFELKARLARSYDLWVNAEGFAPIVRAVEVDATGKLDLGEVRLERTKTVTFSVKLLGRDTAKATPQQVTMDFGGCAHLRADDGSGCYFQLCLNQEGATPLAFTQRASLQPVGSTVVDERSTTRALAVGKSFRLDFEDPWCAGELKVDAVK
ncbi:MAG: hypothetical protein JNM17_12900 [Archangium sp.]|nr:hypothetical protein [Archangium sp.]